MAHERTIEILPLVRDADRVKSIVRRFGLDNDQLQDVITTLSDPYALERIMAHSGAIERRAFLTLPPEVRAGVSEIKDNQLRITLLASILAKREGKNISQLTEELESFNTVVSLPKLRSEWSPKDCDQSGAAASKAGRVIEEILHSEPYLRLPKEKQAEYYALLMSASTPDAQIRAAAKVRRALS